MNSDIFFIHAGTALHSWLNYITAVEREYVLAENSIIYPVSEYLGTKVDPNQIFLDKIHPDLINRYLDLRFINMQEDIECAIEFKYSRIDYTETLSERKRIFNDIMRLKIFVENGTNRKGYFLICGTQIDFMKSFHSIGWNDKDKNENDGLPIEKSDSDHKENNPIEPKGFYTNLFKFQRDETIEIDLLSLNSELKITYDAFYDKYQKSLKSDTTEDDIKKRNPITRLVYISESNNLKEVPTPMKVAIWEITAKQIN